MIQNSGRINATAVFNVVGNIAQAAHLYGKRDICPHEKDTALRLNKEAFIIKLILKKYFF